MTLKVRHAQLAHAGDFDEARSLLIGEAPKLLDMSLRDVIRWQRSVYSIFRLQAERGCDPSVIRRYMTLTLTHRHFRSVLEQLDRLCPPAPTGQRVPMHPLHAAPLITPRPSRRDETLEISLSSPTYTSRLLARATRLLDEKDLTNALSPLLDALSRTTTPTPAVEGKPAVVHDTPDLLPLHLRARVLLCRWYLDAGEAEKAKGELGADLVNEVKAIEDIELLAMVTRCRARCKVALASKEREADFLEAASLFAEAAEGVWLGFSCCAAIDGVSTGFRRASCWDAHRHSLSDLAVVHAERGDIAKRDEAARAWRQAATERLEAERMLTKELEEVQKISVKVSVGVADGTRV